MKTLTPKHFFLFAFLFLFSLSQAQNTDVLLQGFNWESCNNNWYNTTNGKVNTIAEAGFTVVWMPPPSQSEDPQGYRPAQYHNINNWYGNESTLKSVIANFHTKNIKVLADAVINHREGSGCATCFSNPDWGNWAICSNDEYGGSGANDTGEGYGAARDLDHTNTSVQNGLKWYLKGILKDQIGFDGFRYDYSKGYGGQYIGMYNTHAQPYMTIGEYWTSMAYDQPCLFCLNFNQDAHRNKIISWIEATGNSSFAFDFTLKGTLQEAVRTSKFSYLKDASNQPNGVIGVRPDKAVTVLDNHDTGSETQHTWPFYGDNTANKKTLVLQGYAYLMTHPGLPSVFYDHFMSWGIGTEITQLIALRKKNGIHTESKVTIEQAKDNVGYGAIIEGSGGKKVALRLGTGSWTPSSGTWSLALQGVGYTIWESTGNSNVVYPVLSTNKVSGTYIGGVTVTLSATAENNPVTIYYTLNGTTPTTNSSSVTNGGTVVISSNTSFRALAIDSKGLMSNLFSAEYVTEELGIKIRVKVPTTWTSPVIHAWGPAPGYAAITGAWPGVALTVDAFGWYTYLFDPSYTSVNFIISSGDGAQTINIENVGTNQCLEVLSTTDAQEHYDVNETNCTVGISSDNLVESVMVYPNPFTSSIYITHPNTVEKITWSNVVGNCLFTQNKPAQYTQIETATLSAGIYFITIHLANGQIITKKLIKE